MSMSPAQRVFLARLEPGASRIPVVGMRQVRTALALERKELGAFVAEGDLSEWLGRRPRQSARDRQPGGYFYPRQ